MTTATLNTTDQLVADALIRFGITYLVTGGQRTKRDNWDCFQWECTFQYKNERSQGHFTVPYYCGLAHQTKPKSAYIQPRPIAPAAACVLSSLLLDATAINESFADWCDSFGYNEDSLKAMRTYQECIEIGRKVRALFTPGQLAEVSKLLEDY